MNRGLLIKNVAKKESVLEIRLLHVFVFFSLCKFLICIKNINIRGEAIVKGRNKIITYPSQSRILKHLLDERQ